MPEWTINNRASTTLWTTLFRMNQLDTNFEDSGELKVSDLTFFNNLGSADLREQEASVIADQLDNIFRLGRGAKYENGVDRQSAMESMIEVLTDEDKLVSELGETVDAAYRFWRENEN